MKTFQVPGFRFQVECGETLAELINRQGAETQRKIRKFCLVLFRVTSWIAAGD